MDRNVRAGDAERDRVADSLRRHFSEGRLSPEEFDERLGAALAARTMGDLGDLVTDLPPDPDGYALPVPVASTRGSQLSGRTAGRTPAVALRNQLAIYVAVSLLCILIAVGTQSGTWPIWVIGPWGIVLLNQRIRGPGGGGPLDGRRNRGRR